MECKLRLVLSVVVVVVAIIGAAQMSMLGGLAVIVAASIVVIVLLQGEAMASLIVLLGLAYGILCIAGFYSPLRVDDGAYGRVATLTTVAEADMAGHGFKNHHHAMLLGTIEACLWHTQQDTLKMVAAGVDALEPEHTSWLSWAFKPKVSGSKCFASAEVLADISPAYKNAYDAIIAAARR